MLHPEKTAIILHNAVVSDIPTYTRIAHSMNTNVVNLTGQRRISKDEPWLTSPRIIPLVPLAIAAQIRRYRAFDHGLAAFSLDQCLALFPDHAHNAQGAFTPFALAPSTAWISPHQPIFVRPNSGGKSFPGQVIEHHPDAWTLRQTTYNILPNELIFIGPDNDPGPEIRTWIGPKGIYAHSAYTHPNEPTTHPAIVTDTLLHLGHIIGQRIQQHTGMDTSFVVDFSMKNPIYPKIIEWNNPYTSGTYDANPSALLHGLQEYP